MEELYIEEQKQFEQLGILILDGSGSMDENGETGQKKAEEVNKVTKDVILTLQKSSMRNNFFLSILTYDDKVSLREEPTLVAEIDSTNDYNPLIGHGGQTAIGDALDEGFNVAKEFLDNQTDYPRSVIIILMSDGMCNCGKEPEYVVNEIKKSEKGITIYSVGYGKSDGIDELTLNNIVIKGEYLQEGDPEEIRNFFTKTLTTLVG